MAQTRRGRKPRNTTNRIRNAARENLYIYDSAARDLQVRRQMEEEPRKRLSNETRKNRDKALHMNLGYVFFLLGAVCVCAVVLLNYLQLQSDITTKAKSISRLESTLNTKKLANEEEYNRIISSLDLENIRKIAIGELGMSYAQEGQIITYESTGYDYMRRVSE